MKSALLAAFCVGITLGSGWLASAAPVPKGEKDGVPPLSGRMIDLGGYRLHIECAGKGKPPVVLSAGGGAFSTDWALVQPKVAAYTRVCSYDRSGAAWSDLGPKPRTMDQEVFDLHRLLAAAGEHGPYVVVGQSLGGMIARIFAGRYPQEVVGVVLVDAYSEDAQLSVNGEIKRMRLLAKDRPVPSPRTSVSSSDELSAAELAKIADFLKQVPPPKIEAPYDKLPEFAQQVRLWAFRQPKYYAEDDDYMPEISARMYAECETKKNPLGNLPLIVLTRDKYEYPGPDAAVLVREHKAQQARMAKLSTRGEQVTVPNSGHEIQLYAPEAVVNAIREVIAAGGSSMK
ncbi:MAG TPA: alpha/beta hydrolase [Terriglobales bacterium]|nr:alpha/beta hydrolase [Terriglobales bacterium]